MLIFHTHCQEILSLFAATLDVLAFGYSVFICCYSLIKKKKINTGKVYSKYCLHSFPSCPIRFGLCMVYKCGAYVCVCVCDIGAGFSQWRD